MDDNRNGTGKGLSCYLDIAGRGFASCRIIKGGNPTCVRDTLIV